MVKDLTTGAPSKVIAAFAIPMVIGNLFQQLYNVVDSIVVGRFVGTEALAAVGSSFTLMVFLTSILLGLCMGASVVFSQFFGAKNFEDLKSSISTSFIFIGVTSLVLSVLSIVFVDGIITLMNVPAELVEDTKSYLLIIFSGIFFTFLYNWAAGLLRALGNSKIPLYFLILAALTNVVLDLVFVINFQMGIEGAAIATVIAQLLSAVLCLIYCIKKIDFLSFKLREITFSKRIFRLTASYSLLTSVQQSVMNFGILMIQGLVNSFGATTMAAFAAAVKIDSFAYMPVQDFGNAFATYIAQNKGAQKQQRIREGIKVSILLITVFCLVISALVWLFSDQLMLIFVRPTETAVIAIGGHYLRVVSAFYCLIGYLFLFYGLYRGLGNVTMSIVLSVISLGTRVTLAYALVPFLKLDGIWWAIPIGWAFADIVGTVYYKKVQSKIPLGGTL
ncbi:MATE family efflux transporter [Hydrogenoanaerobacterium sp.]|uniref:MATE family efflux transporter n=1 Tax=Hydrogenoanaerobacterium sp. TaxID=2953763 RepID=UPI00289B3662|nr:MATE family efflux transporter [Hydrogenoanaerobacterium sp.]